MIELARFLFGLVEVGAAAGGFVFCTYGYGRWWG